MGAKPQPCYNQIRAINDRAILYNYYYYTVSFTCNVSAKNNLYNNTLKSRVRGKSHDAWQAGNAYCWIHLGL